MAAVLVLLYKRPLEVGKLKIIYYIFFSTDPDWKLNTRKEKSNNAIKGNDFFLQ